MSSWKEICQLIKYADRRDEKNYQRAFVGLILTHQLGWQESQIAQQPSYRIGATKRMIPDVIVQKNDNDKFILEFKRPGHTKTSEDIEQLMSYMKLLETPIGIYVGDELAVYYKEIGNKASSPIMLMLLNFKRDDTLGDDFLSLFSAETFSTSFVAEYANELQKEEKWEHDVKLLAEQISGESFKCNIKNFIKEALVQNGEAPDIIDGALKLIDISIDLKKEHKSDETVTLSTQRPTVFQSGQRNTPKYNIEGRKITAQRYAYSLIKQIINKNPGIKFGQLSALFQHKKNYFEDITEIKDPLRWFMDAEDRIILSDGINIVISNQWGFNGHCKPKMDLLRRVAETFGINISLPFLVNGTGCPMVGD